MSNYLSTIMQIAMHQNKVTATAYPEGINYTANPGYVILIDINMVAGPTKLDYITILNDGRVKDSLNDALGITNTTANYGWQPSVMLNEQNELVYTDDWSLDAVVHIEAITE